MKKFNLIFLLSIIIFILYIFQLFQINKNLDSLNDEGFLYLNIQAASHNRLEGSSQWAMIVYSIFGNTICSNLLFLRIARYFVHFISVALFAFISLNYLKKKYNLFPKFYEKVEYVLFVFLFGAISLGGIIISYNTLQEFFLVSILLCFISSTISNDFKFRFIFNYFLGFLSFFAIMTILPSGFIILFSILILKFIQLKKNLKLFLLDLIYIFIGLVSAIVIFHFLIADIGELIVVIKQTANSITKTNRGYDPLSFVLKIILYFRDYYIHISFLTGLFVISYIVSRLSKNFVGIIFFLISLPIFLVYIKKPVVETTTLVSFPIILLFFIRIIDIKSIKIKAIYNPDTLMLFFLFFSPLLSSIGTNASLANKMCFFILPWSMLLYIMIYKVELKTKFIKYIVCLKYLMILLLSIYPFLSIYSSLFQKNHEVNYFGIKGPISNIVLSDNQKTYFDKVYKIISSYGYNKGDTIFTTQLDHMTIVALNANPSGLYFRSMDYVVDKNKSKLAKPNYIILTNFDLKQMSGDLKKQNWGFPNQFDSFYLGTPELINTIYPTTRFLYCKKNK